MSDAFSVSFFFLFFLVVSWAGDTSGGGLLREDGLWDESLGHVASMLRNTWQGDNLRKKIKLGSLESEDSYTFDTDCRS